MISVKDMQASLAKVGKKLPVRQIAIQSKVNYLTMRNIMSGKSKRITKSVEDRLNAFLASYNPDAPPAPAKKPGRKPGTTTAKKKLVAPRKPVAKSAAAKPAAKAAPAKAVKRRGRPPRAKVQAAPEAAPAKAVKRRGRPPRAKVTPAPAPAAKAPETGSLIMGSRLQEEIRKTKARLDYLLALQKLEETYLNAVK